MVKFNKEEDWLIFNRKLQTSNNQLDYVVSVHKYKGGEPKIQLTKITYNEYGHKFMKFGRVSSEIMKNLIPLINESIEFIKNWNGEKEDIELDLQGGEE